MVYLNDISFLIFNRRIDRFLLKNSVILLTHLIHFLNCTLNKNTLINQIHIFDDDY